MPTPPTSVEGEARKASSLTAWEGMIDRVPTIGVVIRNTATIPPAANARLPVDEATSSPTEAKTAAQSPA